MHKAVPVLIVLAIIISMTAIASASSGGDYELSWWTVDGGGGTSSGGDYEISATIGQPDAGEMSGGDYSVSGGFWGRFLEELQKIFLPLLMR